jgi:hypothetical protein
MALRALVFAGCFFRGPHFVVMCPILFPFCSVNQRREPRGARVIPTGALPAVGMRYSARRVPLVVMRPMLLPLALVSVNQRLPSDPAVMPVAALPALGSGNSVMTPKGVMRPMWLPLYSVKKEAEKYIFLCQRPYWWRIQAD